MENNNIVTFADLLTPRFEIHEKRCPKCSGDVKYTISYYKGEKVGYSLGQCMNPECKVVVHTGAKLCQMNVCEWHEICEECGREICGDYHDCPKTLCDDCYDNEYNELD